MRSDFRCLEDKEGVFEVIADRFVSMEVILLKLLALISLIVFSNFGSGSNFDTSIMLFILRCSILPSIKLIADGFMAAEAIVFR